MISGASESRSLYADAAASEYNAALTDQDARIADSQTQAELVRQGRESVLRKGSVAARATGGMTGSALDVLSDNAAQEELDILTIRHQGLLTQRKYANDANLARFSAANKRASARLGVAGGILKGTSAIAGTILK